MSNDELTTNVRRLLSAISAQVDAIEAERETWEMHSLAEIVAERDALREQLTEARSAVATLRDALLKVATVMKWTPFVIRPCKYRCFVCDSLMGELHKPDCYVGQALAAAAAVLGEEETASTTPG